MQHQMHMDHSHIHQHRYLLDAKMVVHSKRKSTVVSSRPLAVPPTGRSRLGNTGLDCLTDCPDATSSGIGCPLLQGPKNNGSLTCSRP